MADRPVPGRAAGLALVLVAGLLPGCGAGPRRSAGDAGRPSAAQGHEQLVKAAKAALLRYNAHTALAGVYRGHTAAGRLALVRVSAHRRVTFSIVTTCRRHPLRAFPSRPSRLRRDGSFSYREHASGYQLRVSGRVRPRSALGTLALSGRPLRGRPCGSRVRWRALRR